MSRGISIHESPFLGSNGTILTSELFIEHGRGDQALYTFTREDKEVEGKIYPSLYRLYMEHDDITEASFVSACFYGWEQWEKIANGALYRSEIARWRTDLKAKVLGILVQTLVSDATSGSKSSKSSAKYLVDKLSKAAKGKPTTAVIPTTEESAREITAEVARDIQRLSLVN